MMYNISMLRKSNKNKSKGFENMEVLLNLKAWMVVNRVTQKDFAETLGVSLQTVNNKINGRRAFTLPDIQKLNKAYGVDANVFM